MDASEKWMIFQFTPHHYPSKMDVLPKPVLQIIPAAKLLLRHSSTSQNSSDDICLLFCLYLSSMPVTFPLSRCDMSMLTENKHQVNGNTMLAINQLVKNVLVNETQVEERVEILRTNLRRKKHFKNVLKILLKSKSYLQSGINLFGIFREIW